MLLLIACAQMNYYIVHSRTIIYPKANKRNVPRTILELVEEKNCKPTTVAATIRDREAELKLMPRCPAAQGTQTPHNGCDQQPKNRVTSPLQSLLCNYSGPFDPNI